MSERFRDIPDQVFDQLDRVLDAHRAAIARSEVARVTAASSGVATLEGFTDVRANELIRMPGNLMGLASSIRRDRVGVILLGDGDGVQLGDRAERTHRSVDCPVGEVLLGRVVDALGRPIDGRAPLNVTARRPVERAAPRIADRAPVSQPLQTGVKAVDALVPIGRGQRELIVGDRQTGKTAIALSAMLNQRDTGVKCVYCAIGQRSSAVARVVADLRDKGALDNAIVVVASGEDAPGLQFIAPYAATTMAEYFMERGEDVLIVYDDLTRHARAYRELSLLLRRPPGREAYPGDIFYIHSRLLERATHLREAKSGGSLTALPIIETQAQNISAYIPTNLVSITDGQIYLSPDLFEKGLLPAVDVGKSVSRVGGKAQLPVYREVADDLRLSYSQYEELETFARFGTRLDKETRESIERGRRVREVLKQGQRELLDVAEQIAALLATVHGLFDQIDVDDVTEAEKYVRRYVTREVPEICQQIERGQKLSEPEREQILAVARGALAVMEEGAYRVADETGG